MNETFNAELKVELLPRLRASWPEISGFAHSFKGYKYRSSFDKCGKVANSIRDKYKATRKLSTNLTKR